MKALRQTAGLLMLSVTALILLAPRASALTAQEIADSVIDELNNVTDYQAAVDIDYSDPDANDMSDGALSWLRNSGNWMTKMVMGSPYTGYITTDGTNGYNTLDRNNNLIFATMANGDTWVKENFGSHLLNMERVLCSESWSKDPDTHTVNGTECYRLYSNDYEVWIDTATVKKVIRTKMYDSGDNLLWQVDYSNYINVENTAQLPGTVEVQRYDGGVYADTATYTFSDVDINEGLSTSIFAILHP
jgi:outer membrane lipoprotein-sorting protein